MQLTVRPTGAWQHTLDIQIPPDEVERGLDDVARKVQRRAALPGFRKGKVPLPYVSVAPLSMVMVPVLLTLPEM